jgi:DNA-binding transcriptional MerR regulator
MRKKVIYSKDIVARYNIAYPTVTHYTNLGLFTVVGKKGNKRQYDGAQVRARIGKIKKMMDEGYPLRLIRKKLAGGGNGRR